MTAFRVTVARGDEVGNITGWQFADDQPIQFGDASPVTISYGIPSDGLDLQVRLTDADMISRMTDTTVISRLDNSDVISRLTDATIMSR